jgi:hypothetical protein
MSSEDVLLEEMVLPKAKLRSLAALAFEFSLAQI